MCLVDHQIDFFPIQPVFQFIQTADHAVLAGNKNTVGFLNMYGLIVHSGNDAVIENRAVYHCIGIGVSGESLCRLLQEQMPVCKPENLFVLVYCIPKQPICGC